MFRKTLKFTQTAILSIILKSNRKKRQKEPKKGTIRNILLKVNRQVPCKNGKRRKDKQQFTKYDIEN